MCSRRCSTSAVPVAENGARAMLAMRSSASPSAERRNDARFGSLTALCTPRTTPANSGPRRSSTSCPSHTRSGSVRPPCRAATMIAASRVGSPGNVSARIRSACCDGASEGRKSAVSWEPTSFSDGAASVSTTAAATHAAMTHQARRSTTDTKRPNVPKSGRGERSSRRPACEVCSIGTNRTIWFDTVSNTVSDMASKRPAAVGTERARAATLVGVREVPGDMVAKLEAAADELLARFDELQMADIAAAAGIARSSLYYYFANKDDVLSFFLRSTLQALTEATGPEVAAPGDPRSRLRAVIRAQLQHLNDHPSASQLLIANLGRVGKLPDIAASVAAGF